MFPFPQELVQIIAEYDQTTWYYLYKFDERFHNYAKSAEGQRRFIELFTSCEKSDNRTATKLFNKLQSIYNEPALIIQDGYKTIFHWFHQDYLRRADDKPTIVLNCSINKSALRVARYWTESLKINSFSLYENAEINVKIMHRDNDLPAIICGNNKYWINHGKYYRVDNKPHIIREDGDHFWMNDQGEVHSENDQPGAIYDDGTRVWYNNGNIHRIGKPAMIHPDGIEEYWENNMRI